MCKYVHMYVHAYYNKINILMYVYYVSKFMKEIQVGRQKQLPFMKTLQSAYLRLKKRRERKRKTFSGKCC